MDACIIRGEMPVAVVHLLHFGKNSKLSTEKLAAKAGTTTGKIDDIRKNRNFAYVVESSRFTQAEIEEGLAYLKRHPRYAEAKTNELVAELLSYPVATKEEADTFTNARAASRKRSRRESLIV
ncbi:MAG: hypothetical protein LBV49_06755 [Azonexus sp.]|jgi:hypothetical protein|nr:hypothetical protein [Azonexus sp.]